MPKSSAQVVDGNRSDARYGLLFAISFVIALVPFYGYVVHASRDAQSTVWYLALAWGLTWFSLIGWISVALIYVKRKQALRLTILGFAIYLCVCLYYGFYGVGSAIGELWAG